MGRILAIDYGMKRTGMAMTDPLRISINPLPTVETKLFSDKIKSMLLSEDVSLVVFGLPTHADGTLTPVGLKVNELIKKYKKEYPKIEFTSIDESYSSVQAMNLMLELGVKKSVRQKKEKLDQMSAVIILKNFLNSQS